MKRDLYAKRDQLKAKIQKIDARISAQKRKERNGRLVALGILFERLLPDLSQEYADYFLRNAEGLDTRNKDRVLQAFELAKKTTPEERKVSSSISDQKAAFVSDEIVYLVTSYEEKDEVKALGAVYDWEKKKWGVDPGIDLRPFAKWLPEEIAKSIG